MFNLPDVLLAVEANFTQQGGSFLRKVHLNLSLSLQNLHRVPNEVTLCFDLLVERIHLGGDFAPNLHFGSFEIHVLLWHQDLGRVR